MTRSDRSSAKGWDDAPRRDAAPGSLPIRLLEIALRRPVVTGGVAVSLTMLGVIFGNALANQPERHPHPWFSTRPAAEIARPAPVAAPQPLPTVLPKPRPTTALDDPQQVQDLQIALRDRGFYAGAVDGVLGTATVEAVRAFERRIGAPVTGEPTELLIAALRTLPPVAVAQAQPSQQLQPAAQRAEAPVQAAAVVPTTQPVRATAQPTPARMATADAVAYPAGGGELEQTAYDTPVVTTGSIRRAAREPLASGGDERVQKIQRALIAAGYGPLKADGRWDDHSASAVRRYEADRGWPVTGRPTDRLVYGLLLDGTRPRR